MAKRKQNKFFKRNKERTQKTLQNICDKEKEKQYEQAKKVDVTTGDTSEEIEKLVAMLDGDKEEEKVQGEKISKVEEIKLGKDDKKPTTSNVEQPQKKGSFPITKRTITPRVIPPTTASIYMICIEISGSLESIVKQVERCLTFYVADFYQFVFFSNNIHKTKIFKRKVITAEKLKEVIEQAKEQEELLPKENVLLYDAIDETLYLQKEKAAFTASRIHSFGTTKYSLDNIKYLFLISGEEKGSEITKDELQLLIKDARRNSEEFNVALRKSVNLSNTASLGFRNIKAYG